ncbi:hypothetical protein MPSEU_000422600 [Mayamaea pseudoterrestris]|nr:hypothetical protein MPSEU_000422600 [Mayamaea pseudoterrestris]
MLTRPLLRGGSLNSHAAAGSQFMIRSNKLPLQVLRLPSANPCSQQQRPFAHLLRNNSSWRSCCSTTMKGSVVLHGQGRFSPLSHASPSSSFGNSSSKYSNIPLAPLAVTQERRSFASSSRPPLPPPTRNTRLAQGVSVLGAASLLLGKTKYLLAALKVTKLASLGSMVVTIGTYSMFFGVPYATGMVGLILVHETGHALVMLRRNIPFSPMVFVPFMGAVIAMRKQPRDAWEDALVAFGGPALGSAGALGVAVVAANTDSQLLYALADFGFMINLFNMMPLGSMDGGRIACALSKYAGVAGLGIGGSLAYTLPIVNPLFYLIMIAGGYETFQRFYNPAHMPPNYYKITGTQRVALTTGYFGLIGALILAMGVNGQNRKPPEVLIKEREQEKYWKDTHMVLQ